MALRARAPFVAALALATLAPEARAVEAVIDTGFQAQIYQIDGPFGDPVVRRRRYTHTLTLGLYDLDGSPRLDEPQLLARVRMRLDADFGIRGPETSTSRDTELIPGLERAPLDLMYAYLEGRGFFDGVVGFRLGRQYVVDSLGWWSFDGGLLRFTTESYVAAEVYGGFEQRGGLPALSTSRFEADGVYRGARTGYGTDLYPQYLEESALAPAFGGAIETTGLHWLQARATYRRVLNQDTVVVSPFDVPCTTSSCLPAGGGLRTVEGTRISTERAGLGGTATLSGIGSANGTAVYDLYAQALTEWRTGIDGFVTSWLTPGIDFEYFLPTFDADSIWNWFSHRGTTTATARLAFTASRRFGITPSGGLRLFETDEDPSSLPALPTDDETAALHDTENVTTTADGLGALDASYRFSTGDVALHALAEVGGRGRQVGGDVSNGLVLDGGLYDTKVVLSLYDWNDEIRPSRSATSFSYVLGGGISPLDFSRIGVEWEHSMNDLVGQRFRVLATLDLRVTR